MRCRLQWSVLCGFALACEGSSTNPTTVSQSYVEVLPYELPPEPPCKWSGGQDAPFAYYVATLVNLAAAPSSEQWTPLASSAATRCTSRTRFEIPLQPDDTDGIAYQFAAVIDGYRDDPLTPSKKGARSQQTDSEALYPEWMWLCGIGEVSDSRLSQLREFAISLAQTAPPVDAGGAISTPDAGDLQASSDASTSDATTEAPELDARADSTDPTLPATDLPEPAVPQLGRTVSVRGCVRIL